MNHTCRYCGGRLETDEEGWLECEDCGWYPEAEVAAVRQEKATVEHLRRRTDTRS